MFCRNYTQTKDVRDIKDFSAKMNIKNTFTPSSIILKSHVNRFTFLGLAIALGSILIASFIVSYQLTGGVSLYGFVEAQRTNPVIWIMDLTPFLFGYWGQAFCHGLVDRAETLMGETTQEFININNELESKLMHESHYDSLTNLPNARMLSKQIRGSINILAGRGELIVVVLKINDFTNINYNFGTFNANNVLKQFAHKLNSILIDPAMGKDMVGINSVAKLPSDEFALLFPKSSQNTDIDELLNVLVQLVSVNFMVDGISIQITVTAGVSLFPKDGTTEEILLNHANIAAYHAKNEGKTYVVYNDQMEDVTHNRVILSELKNALENEQLDIYYQPVVELSSGIIIGAEALVRFNHPQYGLLNAEKFVPLIEGTNLIRQLTYFVLSGAIKQLAAWDDSGYKLFVSVNLSIKDISDPDLPMLVKQLLNEANVPADLLKLEFTEKACLSDQAATREILEQLTALGIKLTIDDFCSGYSSFMYLVNYPINDVKIEKSLVLKMVNDVKKDKIVETVILVARTLNLEVAAEGVADENILNRLQELGCQYGQGFHFSKAVSAPDFERLLHVGNP